MTEWLPIESAPKDGRHVLICREGWRWARAGAFSSGCWWANGERLKVAPELWMPMSLPPGSDRSDDAADRAALNKALDDQAAGRLETISHADLKARLNAALSPSQDRG